MKISTLFKKGRFRPPGFAPLFFFTPGSADSGGSTAHTGTNKAANLPLRNQKMKNDPTTAGMSVERITLTLNADNSCSITMTFRMGTATVDANVYGSYTYHSATVTIGTLIGSIYSEPLIIDLRSTPLQYEDGKLVYEENGVRETVFVKI